MATTSSSRAITSTDRLGQAGRVIGLAAILALGGYAAIEAAAPRSPPPVASQTAPVPAAAGPVVAAGPSFYEPFDRLDLSRWAVSDGWLNGDHQGCTWSRDNAFVQKGVLQMVLAKARDRLRPYRCAELKTNAALGHGAYEARIRTAAGSGLNTAMFSYVGPVHDELDFEFLGKDTGIVQLNYWTHGQGGRETFPKLGFDASAGFHDYAFVWEPGRLRWFIDGRLVREENGGAMPTTAANFFLTLWSGSHTIDGWLGPLDEAKTPAVAEVDWAAFTRAGERCRFPQSITCKLP